MNADFVEARLVPELTVQNLQESLKFYIDLLEFKIVYDRPENLFAYIERQGAQIMLEQLNGNWEVAELRRPFGRGVNFQLATQNIVEFHRKLTNNGVVFFKNIHTETYRTGESECHVTQFLLQDPDGYLIRFLQEN